MTKRKASKLTLKQLDSLIEDAIVDASDESEQAVGFLTLMEEHLALPFETTVLEQVVSVTQIDVTRSNEIVVICVRGKAAQAIPILSLPLPYPRPVGAEWIDAYRRWRGE